MRLLLKLVPKESHPYINDYHYHLQSAIYSLIKEGGMPELHERKGYKFFCFSHPFPFGNFVAGAEKNLLISSPDARVIKSIERALLSKIKSNDVFFIGEMRFTLSKVRTFELDLNGQEITVHSATPIVMRIPKIRYDQYGIKPKVNYDYLFWRENFPFEAFVNQLRDNIVKKTREFMRDFGPFIYGYDFHKKGEGEISPEIVYYKFIRSVAKVITVRQQRQTIIGSIWDLTFLVRKPADKFLLNIALESGLGERNPLGFGFVNLAINSVRRDIQ